MIFDDRDQLQIRHECERMVITIRQRSCGKVMFSVVSVHHSVQGGSYVTITHDALDFNVQGLFPPPIPRPWALPHATDIWQPR